MDELVQWLGEQLDEDERIAQEASGWLKPAAHWSLDEWFGRETPHSLIAQGSPRLPVAGGHFTADPVPTVQGEHIVRHDPARVLHEIDAKRRLLELHAPDQMEYVDGDVCMVCDVRGEEPFYPCATVRLLALPYAGRPGYREEWRP
ncbi:DUF6221 family protein [Streptomyces sp. NPDC017638]|uniref:DUF6221 family protein n=1 Tax=Streptomyces sp. NPDC017638 TaxID=3365004 RepID=UPI0037BD8139